MGISPKQVKAIPLIVSGIKSQEVAKEIGVTPQTISEWQKNPEFVVMLNKAKKEILDAALDELRGGARDAANCLTDLANNAENEEVRRKSALNILELTGIKDPSSGVYGWGIGSTNLTEAEKQIQRQENPELYNILGDMYPYIDQ